MDINGDGQLTRDEILEAYKKIMDEEQAELEVQKIMEVVDMDQVNLYQIFQVWNN